MTTRHLNPEGMHRNPAFSQAVVVEAPARTIYVGGQNGVDADGNVVGDSLADQARQAFADLRTVLAAEGATLADVVHWSIAMVAGQPMDEGFAAFQEAWDPNDPPPAISFQAVSALANPRFLIELTAVAAV